MLVKDGLTTWNETNEMKVIDNTLAVLRKSERKAGITQHMNVLRKSERKAGITQHMNEVSDVNALAGEARKQKK